MERLALSRACSSAIAAVGKITYLFAGGEVICFRGGWMDLAVECGRAFVPEVQGARESPPCNLWLKSKSS